MNSFLSLQAVRTAENNAHLGDMTSSAALCAADARSLLDAGRYDAAKVRALHSLSYSIGIFAPTYRRLAGL